MKILLVDDDYLLAQGVAQLIESLSQHHVIITDCPTTIFSHCHSGEIDVVMMDVNLPGITWKEKDVSGIEICQMLKQDSLTANIPIILFTAYPILSQKPSLFSTSGADYFLSKPIKDYPAFLQLIEELYHKNRG